MRSYLTVREDADDADYRKPDHRSGQPSHQSDVHEAHRHNYGQGRRYVPFEIDQVFDDHDAHLRNVKRQTGDSTESESKRYIFEKCDSRASRAICAIDHAYRVNV